MFSLGKLNIRRNSIIAQLLNVRSTPQIVIFDPSLEINNLNSADKYKIFHFVGSLRLNEVLKFAVKKFESEVTIVRNDDDIVVWRKQNLDKIHLILFSNLNEPPISYELVTALLKNIAVFAFATVNPTTFDDFPRAFGSLSLRELPVYILYRMGTPKDDTFGGIVTPIVAPMELDSGSIAFILRQYSYPVFSVLTVENHQRICKEYCILYVKGVDLADDIKIGIHEMNIPTATINLTTEPDFISIFHVDDNDFLVLKPKTKQFMVWKEVTTWAFFRTKIEYMDHGLIEFQKCNAIPKIFSI